jgi:hypothetical membrane protein
MNDARSDAVTVLAGAGIVGPVGFILVVVIQGVLQPEYSHVTMPVSALAAEPSGWIQNVNFMGLGILLIAHAVGLHLGVRRSRWGILGPLLLAVSGLCIVGAGVFPATDASGAFSPQPIHSGVSVLAFLSAGFGMIALSRRLTRDPDWAGYSRYVLLFGVGVLLLLFSFGGLAVSPEAPLYEWMGIVQRALIGTWLAGILILAYRLLHIGRR